MKSTLVAILIFCFFPIEPVEVTEGTYEDEDGGCRHPDFDKCMSNFEPHIMSE